MRINPWVALAGFLAASFAAAALGGYATATSVRDWFPLLNKPPWNPPGWVFGPVWTILYILMSVAVWRVWCRSHVPGARGAVKLFFVQLALNALWSILFFGFQSPGLALVEIVILWTVLLNLLRTFARVDRPAGWLWLPYFAWVSFAVVLNASIWWLNR